MQNHTESAVLVSTKVYGTTNSAGILSFRIFAIPHSLDGKLPSARKREKKMALTWVVTNGVSRHMLVLCCWMIDGGWMRERGGWDE